MKLTGKITKAFPEIKGMTKTNNLWRKREFIVTYDESNANYPKSILFSVMNDRIDTLNIQEGGVYELDIDFETREYNGRWWMSATVWRATLQVGSPQAQVQTPPPVPVAPHPPISVAPLQPASDPNGENLPF